MKKKREKVERATFEVEMTWLAKKLAETNSECPLVDENCRHYSRGLCKAYDYALQSECWVKAALEKAHWE